MKLAKTIIVIPVTVTKSSVRRCRPLTVCYGTLYYDAVAIQFGENLTSYSVGSYSRIWHPKLRMYSSRLFVAEHFHVRTTKDLIIMLNNDSGPEIMVAAGAERYIGTKTVKIFVKRAGTENGIAYFTFEGNIIR